MSSEKPVFLQPGLSKRVMSLWGNTTDRGLSNLKPTFTESQEKIALTLQQGEWALELCLVECTRFLRLITEDLGETETDLSAKIHSLASDISRVKDWCNASGAYSKQGYVRTLSIISLDDALGIHYKKQFQAVEDYIVSRYKNSPDPALLTKAIVAADYILSDAESVVRSGDYSILNGVCATLVNRCPNDAPCPGRHLPEYWPRYFERKWEQLGIKD